MEVDVAPDKIEAESAYVGDLAHLPSSLIADLFDCTGS
tara:strand:+ start:25384 stop:25497 length:114 start_codon:yes stop_codon:yes gene_type:complete